MFGKKTNDLDNYETLQFFSVLEIQSNLSERTLSSLCTALLTNVFSGHCLPRVSAYGSFNCINFLILDYVSMSCNLRSVGLRLLFCQKGGMSKAAECARKSPAAKRRGSLPGRRFSSILAFLLNEAELCCAF